MLNRTIHHNNLVFICLTQNKWTVIDEADYPAVIPYRWCAVRNDRSFRVAAHLPNNKTCWMHRLIHPVAAGLNIDHRDGNGLNNRRANLRAATAQQNARNKGVHYNSKTGYAGVRWDPYRQRWWTDIRVDGKIVFLGRFICFKRAVSARKSAETKYFGEFARVRRV